MEKWVKQCYVHKYRNLEAMLCRLEVGQKERRKQIKLILGYNKEVKGSPRQQAFLWKE